MIDVVQRDVVLIEPGPILTEWNAIARENLAKTSAGGAYCERAAAMARVFETVDAKGRSSHPVVVAKKIVKAAAVKRPRARYPLGRSAGSIVRVRKMLPDRAMDAIITRMFR